jgi:hypothetical protein
MNPTKQKTDLDKIQEQFNTTMLNNPGAYTGTISAGLCEDTITLSPGNLWSNSSITNTSITGGGYTVAPNVTLNGGLYSTGTVSQPWSTYTGAPKIKLDGEGADIEVNGWSLIESIKKIEERLNILTPNTELETEWEELRALGDEYRKLEQHIKDKQATWDKLKAMPPPVVD